MSYRPVSWIGPNLAPREKAVTKLITLVLAVACVPLSAQSTGSISVSGQANIFGAGLSSPPGGPLPGIIPPFIHFPSGSGQVITFPNVTGVVSFGNPFTNTVPDGLIVSTASTNFNPQGGISGIIATPIFFLVGVFLTDSAATAPPPPTLSFSGNPNFAELSPVIGQTFFIGDGLTGTGTGQLQKFHVPPTATRLFLGFADGADFQGDPKFYGDNSGALTVQYNISSGCQVNLSIPEFTWKEYDSRWGINPYDHSYISSPFFFSLTGHMQLAIGANTYPLDVSSANNLTGLAVAINRLNVGVYALPQASRLRVYNEHCLLGGNCYPFSANVLTLCDGSCTSNNNLLTPKSMSGLGCSITTLAMALKFAGIPSVTPFTLLDPGSLDNFMSNDLLSFSLGGWFGNTADVDWDNTTSAVALSSGIPLPQSFTFDDTGMGTPSQPDPTQAYAALDNALCTNNVPAIVRVTGLQSHLPHFVLVTGKQGTATDGSQYLIADPGSSSTTSLKDYSNQFTVVGAVTDPTTDRGKLVVRVDDYANAMIVDANGRRAGFDPATGTILKEIPLSFYDEDQIGDDTGTGDTTGLSHVIGVRQPTTGSYQIVVTGLKNWPYLLSVSPFSQDGSSQGIIRFNGIAGVGSSTTYQIQYVSLPGETSQVILKATFQSTLTDISNYLQLRDIDNQGIANSLSQKIEAAQNVASAARSNILRAFKDEVSSQSDKHIFGVAEQVLLQDADSLISQNP